MSLKALASETLARLRGTEDGTLLEQVERAETCSTDRSLCSSPVEHDLGQKSAINGACSTVPFSRAGTGGTTLPPEIQLGLKRLRFMPVPRITIPRVWPEIVEDAVSICNGDWASRAIELGWHPLHLFGVEPSAAPDEWGFSLAVFMQGWPIVDVAADYITMRRGNACRPFKNRPRPALTKYLWEI